MIKNTSLLKSILLITFFITFLSVSSQEINIPNDSSFFTGITPTQTITINQPVTSDKINTAINNFGVNGGVIHIPEGTHLLDKIINLKSNTHIIVAENAVFKPTSAFFIFDIGTNGRGNQQKIENVKIASASGKFIIDYSNFQGNDRVAGFTVGWVENFLIDGVSIKDNQTFLAGISVTPPSGGDWNRIAKNGIISNCTITNADYGYGLIQVQAAENVLFKNLEGSGGVTLRFESGFRLLREAGVNVGTSTKLYGLNITGINGNAAVMVSPHTKKQGSAIIKNITSRNCSLGIRIDKGFTEGGFPAGTYNEVIVGGNINITRDADESKNLAQIKQKHYIYYPLNFRNDHEFTSFALTAGTDPTSRKAPAIAPILFDAQNSIDDYTGDGKYKVTFRTSGHSSNSQTYSGFRSCTPNVLYEDDKRRVCLDEPLLSLDALKPIAKNRVYPIPTTNHKIFIETTSETSTIKIYSPYTGSLLKVVTNTGLINEIDLSDIPSGNYILQIVTKDNTISKKIIII